MEEKTKFCTHQDPEERSSDLTGDYLLMLGGPMWRHGSTGAHHKDRGTGGSPLAFLDFTINPPIEPVDPRAGSPQTKKLPGSPPLPPSADNWIKALVSKALPTRARPSFSHGQTLPARSLHKPLSLMHQRVDRRRTVSQQLKQKLYYRK